MPRTAGRQQLRLVAALAGRNRLLYEGATRPFFINKEKSCSWKSKPRSLP